MPIDATERQRRRGLLAAHYKAENDHALEQIMATFSPRGEMIYNGQPFRDPDSIRGGHVYIGFAEASGALADLVTLRDHEHFTDDAVVVEGRLQGRHVGEFQGFAPTGRAVELPFTAFYVFDAEGALVSERVVMNLGPLGGGA